MHLSNNGKLLPVSNGGHQPETLDGSNLFNFRVEKSAGKQAAYRNF
jgi:hypothetical protein